MKKFVPVTRPSIPRFEEYIREIEDLWETRWLTNKGPKHKKLEEELKEFLKVPFLNLFTNGHLALESAIQALELKGEVITTPFTFASTTHAIVRKGLKPVFCDINSEDFTIDPEKIEELITDKTSAIIPVHVYGNICEVDEIDRIGKKHNLKVIYDAAHAFAVKVNGQGIGNFGDISMFSFHATKVFNTIEGGALAYKEKELEKRIDSLKNFGFTDEGMVDFAGGNAKMNEFQAAMGLCNLPHIEEEIEKRKKVVKRYMTRLNGLTGIKLISPKEGVKNNYAYFPVLFEDFSCSRDQIFEELKKNGIHARKYFYPLTSNFRCYEGHFIGKPTPVADYVAERVLTLPLYSDLNLDTVDNICEIILNQA